MDERHPQSAYQFAAPTVPHALDRPFARPDRLHHPLYVITPIVNVQRFRSRWRLYADFKKMVAEAGAILFTIEVAFGDRDFVVTNPDDPHNIQLRTHHELWLKERMINLAVQRLPLDWQKVALIDADCHFARYDWADETKHLLEQYPAIQMWSTLQDLNSDHEVYSTFPSFGAVWQRTAGMKGSMDRGHPYRKPKFAYSGATSEVAYPGAPGLAWAWNRDALDQVGGLIDCLILGAGDSYMAHALVGECKYIIGPQHGRLGEIILEWEDRARKSLWHERSILGNLGVMKGTVFHYAHGPKAKRLYGTREQILARHGFNPDVDLKADWQGLYQLTNRNPQLRRDVAWYFNQRDEDAPIS